MHINRDINNLLLKLNLGESVAEVDTLLEIARVETSAFSDILNDRVDLVPGTKGSGKSALFRIFVEFLPNFLLDNRKVVVAHGVQAPGDPVFHAFNKQFSNLTEEEFVSFWCIYLVSLAHEQFIKSDRYASYLLNAKDEITRFKDACAKAHIPEISARRTLKSILEWTLEVLADWRPKVKYKSPDGMGDLEFDLFGRVNPQNASSGKGIDEAILPKYVNEINQALESVLLKCNLSLWLMIDRLDEIFPRRSELERKALRGLLRAMRYFSSSSIRVKVFLRDDMLDQVVRAENGFTALTHVTVRQSDTLRWTNDQIMTMLVKRIFANKALSKFMKVDKARTDASAQYRADCFYKVFPPTVYKGKNQSPTLRWICNRCSDGRNVVTPRDVLDLVIRAKQRQQDICTGDPEGHSDYVIGSAALQYGYEELSKRKKQTYLQAEFPHLWVHMEKFIGKKTDYDLGTLRTLLGKEWNIILEDLIAIGFLARGTKNREDVYRIPFLYRHSMELTQGRA